MSSGSGSRTTAPREHAYEGFGDEIRKWEDRALAAEEALRGLLIANPTCPHVGHGDFTLCATEIARRLLAAVSEENQQ